MYTEPEKQTMNAPFNSKTAREAGIKSGLARAKGSLVRKQILVSPEHERFLRKHNASELIRQLLEQHIAKQVQ